MNGHAASKRTARGPVLRLGLRVSLVTALASCAAVPATLTSALIGLGQDLLLSAAENFTPDYADSAGGVLLALAETATGQPFTQSAAGGLVPVAGSADGASEAYGVNGSAYGDGYGSAYGAESPEGAEGPVFAQQGGGSDAGSDTYRSDYTVPTGQAGHEDPGFYAQWESATSPPPQVQNLVLDVAVLAQRRRPDGIVDLQPVADGEVLTGTGPDARRGDKVKFFFRSNCACYLYIVGVDATAWITNVYPRNRSEYQPIQPNIEYLVPEGRLWWALDEYQGVETIYFVLSRTRLTQLEQKLATLPVERPDVPGRYRPVTVAAVMPTRGLVLVEDTAPASVPTGSSGVQIIDPLGFTTQGPEMQLVVTRWFEHR